MEEKFIEWDHPADPNTYWSLKYPKWNKATHKLLNFCANFGKAV